MKMQISFNLDNAAFASDTKTRRSAEAVAERLRALADRIDRGTRDLEAGDAWPLRDSNGNRIGDAEVKRSRAGSW